MLEEDALLTSLDGIAHRFFVKGAQQQVAHVTKVGLCLLHDSEQLTRREQQGVGLATLHILQHGRHSDIISHDVAAWQGNLDVFFGEHGTFYVAIVDVAVLSHALAFDALCLNLPLGTQTFATALLTHTAVYASHQRQ